MRHADIMEQLSGMVLRLSELEANWVVKEPEISDRARLIIEENIELIEQNRFNELFDKCFSDIQIEVAEALLTAGFDLEKHLHSVPPALKNLFCDTEKFNVSNYAFDFAQEMDKFVKQTANALHIPACVLTQESSLKKWESSSDKTWAKSNKWLEEVERYA